MKKTQIKTHAPGFDEVQKVLDTGLRDTFTNVSVSVLDCPDLTQPPFHLSSQGLCGNPRLVDIGGPSYLLPLAQRDKIYHHKKVAELAELPNAFMIGAAAGPAHVVGTGCELISNIKYEADGRVINNTYTSRVDAKTGACILEKPDTEEFSLLGNFLLCDGLPGKVIEVKASKRHGSDDFIASLRKTLGNQYGDKPVGLGGVFLVEKGKAHAHVIPDYSETPLPDQKAVQEWLKNFTLEAPLVCVGYLVTCDPGYDLWSDHFHAFSQHGEGGHFHCDVTPDEVEYRGYFTIAESMFRLDQPAVNYWNK